MICAPKFLTTGCLLACLLLTTERIVLADSTGRADPTPTADQPEAANQPQTPATEAAPAEEKPAAKAASDAPAAVMPVEKPKRELTPAQIALRDQVRHTLAQQQKQPLNTRDNLPNEIAAFCLGFGCNTEISLEGVGGKKINGITCLCWNYPCAGFEMLGPGPGHLVARIGYGYQQHPGEFLAMLAMSRVPSTYPIRFGNDKRTVADLVEAEKLICRAGGDMSLKLIGLAFYVESREWKNDLGEDWSIERMVQQEIAQPVVSATDGGLNRLMGLSFVVAHRVNHALPIDGQYQRAQKYLNDFHDFALTLQNADGSWGPALFAARSTTNDAAIQLSATGRVLEWLALSLPDGRLEDPRVIRSVELVIGLLNNQRYQRNVPYLPTRELDALGHALHSLSLYDERVFAPADVEEKPAAESSTVEQSKPTSLPAAANQGNSTAKTR
jgi:hypothetical protein